MILSLAYSSIDMPSVYRSRIQNNNSGTLPTGIDPATDPTRQGRAADVAHLEQQPLTRQTLLECCFHIEGVPRHDRVDDQSQRPELVFLSLVVPLAQFSPLAMKDSPRHTMSSFPPIELGEHAPPIALIINVGQHGERLWKTSQRRNDPRERGRTFTPEDRAHEFGRTHRALVERACSP
jgi:hypothetical protein